MDALRQDFRYAVRALRRAPAITALVVGSLGLAIAGTTAVFSILNALLFRPMPYEAPERLALLGEYQDPALAGQIVGASAANYLDWRERQDVFRELAAYVSSPVELGAAGGGGGGEPVPAAAVTPSFFRVLGVAAGRGRDFLPEEGGARSAARVVALDHGLWQRRFAGDPGILGRTVTLNGEQHTVVGILPERFEFLDPQVELWRPLGIDPARASRDRRDLLVVGRMAPGVATTQAAAAMASLGERLEEEYPEANRGYTVQVLNLREQVPSPQDRQLLALVQGALVFVLLIACANVANLFLARTQGRVTELAVRSSLGAGRLRIARQLATEALVAATAGGLVGLGGGWLATRAIAGAMAAQLPRFWLPTVDLPVVLFTAGVSAVAGLLVGSLPAVQAARMRVPTALKEGGRGARLGGGRRLVSRGLVVAEIALSLVLLGGGAVLIRSFVEIQSTDPGFETAGLATFRVDLPEEETAGHRSVVIEESLRRLEGLPGVAGVAASSARPRTPFLPSEPYTVEGAPPPEGQAPPSAGTVAVDPDYFATLDVPVVAGRSFTATDEAGAAPVAVVNRSLARRHWGDGDPLGRRIVVRGEPRRIVGVVEDLRHAIFRETGAQPALYLPIAQEAPASVAVTLRAEGPIGALANPVREALRAYDPGLMVSQVQSLDDFVAQFFVGMQVVTSILAAFGTLALLLAALGTYGVLAYSVAQRTHEIGVRMALGAKAGQVRGMVTRQGLILAGLGIGVGVPGVIAVTRLVGSTVEGLASVEPLTVVAVAGVLAVVTVLASWMPARRAAAVDPIVALRGE